MTNQTQNKRDSFIFYRSFFEATKWLKIDEKAQLFDAICSYALDGETKNLDGTAKGMFELVKPQLDANRKRFENGCVKKQNGSKMEAKRKQKRSKSKANDNVNVNVNEECKLELKLESQLPIFINKDLFDSFVEMRNKIKKPLTDKAKELLLKDLTNFENLKAGNANIALENSIKNSWQGVFEPKTNNQQQQPKQTFLTKQQIEQNQNMQIFSNLQKKYEDNNA